MSGGSSRLSPGNYTPVAVTRGSMANRDPVFHRTWQDPDDLSIHDPIWPSVFWCKPRRSGRTGWHVITLPRVHAEGFARPCKRCLS